MTIIIPLLMKEESKDLNILDLMPYMHYFMCETSYLTQKISLNCWHFVFRIVPSSKISMTTIRYIILSVSYKKQELLTLHRHLNSPPIFWLGLHCSSFYFFLCCSIVSLRSEVPCCDVHYDFHILYTMLPVSLDCSFAFGIL